MFYKTINEWRTHKKDIAINEGGGAGISFKAEAVVEIVVKLTKAGDQYNMEKVSSSIDCDKFDASGYQDGMDNVRGSLINWTLGAYTIEDLLNIKQDTFVEADNTESS